MKPVVGALLLMSMTISERSAADAIVYRWESVPKAAGYQGTVTHGGVTRRFLTRETWLLLDEGSTLRVEAVDETGTPMRPVKVTGSTGKPGEGAAGGRPPVASPEPEDEPDEPEPPKPAPPPPDPEDADDPDPTIEPTVRASGDTSVYLTLRLGLGKEWLAAVGGASDFTGSSGIGGTFFNVLVDGGKSAPWQILAGAGAYNFTTTTTDDKALGGAAEKESKFLRLSGRLLGFYRFGGDEPGANAYGIGLGVTYFRLPALTVPKDSTTGAGELELRSVTVPVLGAHIELAPDRTDSWQFLALYAPAGKATHTSLSTAWRHRFAKTLHTDLGLTLLREKVEFDVTCPAVAGCAPKSTAKADALQAQVGLGMQF